MLHHRTRRDQVFRFWELLGGIQLQRDVMPRVDDLNHHGIACSFSYLPIESFTITEIDFTLNEYKHLIDVVSSKNIVMGIKNDITIKLYQFGQYRFPEYFHKKLEELVEYASMRSVFLRFDTSDRVIYGTRNIIDETIMFFDMLHQRCKNEIGICLQSYHARTEKDLQHCLEKGYIVRLVKGFYADGDIQDWLEVTEHYKHLAQYALQHPNLKHLAIATHDRALVQSLGEFTSTHKIPGEKFSIQGFWGIQNDYYFSLHQHGYNVKIYIPYGNFLQFFWRGWKWMDKKRILRRMLGMRVR